MTSYLKYFGRSGYYGKVTPKWQIAVKSGDIFPAIRELSAANQLRFVANQTLSVSYLFWIYGPQSHEMPLAYSKVLKEYTDNVVSNLVFDEQESLILRSVKSIQNCWYGKDWIDVDISSLVIFLYDLSDNKDCQLYPECFSKAVVIPYLMQRNHKPQQGYDVYPGKVDIPRFNFVCCMYGGRNYGYCSVYQNNIGVNFARDLLSKGIKNDDVTFTLRDISSYGMSFLEMYLKTDLSSKRYETLLSDMAWMCLHRDTTVDMSGNFRLFYAIETVLHDLFSADFLDISRSYGHLPLEYPEEQYAWLLFKVLRIVLNITQGVKVTSRDMFIKFFREFCKNGKSTDIQKIINFVEYNRTNVASAEDLAAYEKSPLAGIEAIELISQRNPVIRQDTGTDKTVEETEGDEEENLDLSDIPELDDAEPALEAENNTAEEEQDTTTDGDAEQGSDDSSSGNADDNGDENNADTQSEDDNEGDDPSNSSGDDNQEAGASDDAAGGTDPNSDTQAGSAEPEDLDASDDIGIDFKVSPEGSETVDSVIYREELDSFITDILTNPPKKLSPQSISALTALQKYWLHILTIETITGILERIVSLPEKYKNIQNTHGENS